MSSLRTPTAQMAMKVVMRRERLGEPGRSLHKWQRAGEESQRGRSLRGRERGKQNWGCS